MTIESKLNPVNISFSFQKKIQKQQRMNQNRSRKMMLPTKVIKNKTKTQKPLRVLHWELYHKLKNT